MNDLKVNYILGGGLAISKDFQSFSGTAASNSLAINLEGQPPPQPITGFQFLTASGGSSKVCGIGFYPGPNGTVSGTNQPIVDKLANSNMSDCFQVVNSAFNYIFGDPVPGSEVGVQRLSFPAVAGYQIIDTQVDIYSRIQRIIGGQPQIVEFFCLPIGTSPNTRATYCRLVYLQEFPSSGARPATCSVANAMGITMPPDFIFEGTGTLRSVFVKIRELTLGTSLNPGGGVNFVCSISLFQQP